MMYQGVNVGGLEVYTLSCISGGKSIIERIG